MQSSDYQLDEVLFKAVILALSINNLNSSDVTTPPAFTVWDFNVTRLEFELVLETERTEDEMQWKQISPIDWPVWIDGKVGTAPEPDPCFFVDCDVVDPTPGKLSPSRNKYIGSSHKHVKLYNFIKQIM